jgi:hypothetical protein
MSIKTGEMSKEKDHITPFLTLVELLVKNYCLELWLPHLQEHRPIMPHLIPLLKSRIGFWPIIYHLKASCYGIVIGIQTMDSLYQMLALLDLNSNILI